MEKVRELELSAFIPPPNGRMVKNGVVEWGPDFRTYDRYVEYKNCGFTDIMLAGEDKYEGEPYETSDIKMLLDLAHKVGLKAIIIDGRILSMSINAKNSVLEEYFNGDQDKMRDYFADCMKDYKLHPAFYGLAIIDEPTYEKTQVVKEITQTIKAVKADTFVHTCFLPPADESVDTSNERIEKTFGKGFSSVWSAYESYVQGMCETGLGYYGFDRYPLGFWEGKNSVAPYYLRMVQTVAEKSMENDVAFHITIQSFASGKDYVIRPPQECDLNWQTNIALGFGCEKIYYYSYWRFRVRTHEYDHCSGIIDEDGTKIIYDEVQRNNALAKRTYQFLRDYTYTASRILKTEKHMNQALWSLKEKDFGFVLSHTATAPLLLNKLSKQDGDIYMVMNMRDPYEQAINTVKLRMENPKPAYDVVVRGRKMQILGEGEWLSFTLEPGEAVFIIDEK